MAVQALNMPVTYQPGLKTERDSACLGGNWTV